MRVYLASTSPARKMLLTQAGIAYETRSPEVDEDAVIAQVTAEEGAPPAPVRFVQLLADAKASAVAQALVSEGANGLVIGGDSMFELEGVVYGKPHTAERATERWLSMRGRTGALHSGLTVIRVSDDGSLVHSHAVTTARVTFASDVSDAEISAYVATGEPLEVAGAFTLDSLGAAFIERIDGDPSTVIGMSIPSLRRLTKGVGIEWTALWDTQ